MSSWFDTFPETAFNEGEGKEIEIEGIDLIIIKREGSFYAIENVCPHDGGLLSSGIIEEDEIVCPRHGARFCIRTGEVTCPPAFEDLDTFPIKIKDGIIQVAVG